MTDGQRSPCWWEWPHSLGLDAVLVALCWQWYWGQVVQLVLPKYTFTILGLGVWAIYLSDRLLDARRDPALSTLRHRVAQSRSLGLSILAGSVGLAGLWLAVTFLSLQQLRLGFVLAAIVLGYFLIVHRGLAGRLPIHMKEITVGVVFASGTAFFPLTFDPHAWDRLLVPLVFFASLCALNCVYISTWESGGSTTRIRLVCIGLASLTLAVDWLSYAVRGFPIGIAALLMVGLDRLSINVQARRVLVDLTLLTPLLNLI